AAAATGVGAMVLNGESGSTASTPSAAESTVAGPPPGDVRLLDGKSTITLTWADPSDGTVPFTIVGGRAGQPMRAMATVDPGQTSYTVNGLNPGLDYCFTVLAAWPTGAFATSAQVCTGRAGGAATT
ncbi:fibronectin type III domain-containing protein, partial [Micromonospora azadirachtae]